MRTLAIRIIGACCIAVALLSWAKVLPLGLFIPGAGYNLFLIAMGILAFAAVDLGPKARRWFDFIFGISLVVGCFASVGAWLYGSKDAYVGTIIFNGLAAIGVLYFGYQLPQSIKPPERPEETETGELPS